MPVSVNELAWHSRLVFKSCDISLLLQICGDSQASDERCMRTIAQRYYRRYLRRNHHTRLLGRCDVIECEQGIG